MKYSIDTLNMSYLLTQFVLNTNYMGYLLEAVEKVIECIPTHRKGMTRSGCCKASYVKKLAIAF